MVLGVLVWFGFWGFVGFFVGVGVLGVLVVVFPQKMLPAIAVITEFCGGWWGFGFGVGVCLCCCCFGFFVGVFCVFVFKSFVERTYFIFCIYFVQFTCTKYISINKHKLTIKNLDFCLKI